MRIAYGVMGYGRGHSTRVRAVLPALMQEHEVTLFAGGDAYDMLSNDCPTVRIPTLGYAYGKDRRTSTTATIAANASQMTQLMFGGESLRQVMREFRDRDIDLVISDSEAWTHQAARRLRIPRIGFDHVGIIAYCAPHYPAELALRGSRDGWGYRRLMGQPDRILISSFYPARPLLDSTAIVGPMLRPDVHRVQATPGDYLLAYFNKGREQYSPQVEKALTELSLPVVVYGTGETGTRDNLSFRAIDNAGFLRDLAGCRAVMATAGNQLIGETLHFRKPILALPERVFEQQLNAWIVQRMGIGHTGSLSQLSTDSIEVFLAEVPGCAARMDEFAGDGREAAISTLRRFIGELAPQVRARPSMSRLGVAL